MDNKKICAVIVTFNRSSYLQNLLKALLEQTFGLEGILIFDNHSNDGTDTELLNSGYCSEIKENNIVTTMKMGCPIYYYRNSENTGGSGGFHKAIKIASEMQKFDYLWCMDDDVMPVKNCLEELTKHMSEDTEICIPNRTGNGYQDYAITNVDLKGVFYRSIESYKKKVFPDEIHGDTISVEDMAFEGPLISTKLIHRIGLPNKDLFILFDDSEYAMRASKQTQILFVKTASLIKQIIPKAGMSIPRWKIYYNFRNAVWFMQKYGENFMARKFRPLIMCFYWMLKYAAKSQIKYANTVLCAYRDGKKGNLGKTVDPSTYK